MAIDCWLLAIEPVPSAPIREIRGGKKRFVLISADSWTQKISAPIREIRGGKKRFVLISTDSWTQKISAQIRELRGGKKRLVLISADLWTQKISAPIRGRFFWAFRLSPSGFPLYLRSLHFRPAPLSFRRSRPRFQSSHPFPLAKDAAPIPNA